MKNIHILFILCFLLAYISFAQEKDCGAMESLEHRIKQDPELLDRMNEIEAFIKVKTEESNNGSQNKMVGNVIIIPVVVHVLYTTPDENISDSIIQSQIDVLNEDFRRTNSDANNLWPQAADTEIEFCLTTLDPNGNLTTGITRTPVTSSNWNTLEDKMKSSSTGGIDPWDTNRYLNIWVTSNLWRPFLLGTILGYAQFPGGDPNTDGIVVDYKYFGKTGIRNGRVGTHEVGHYLNLRHTWGDAPVLPNGQTNGCGYDDFVSDTPEEFGPGNCDVTRQTCNSVDMVNNYMNYGNCLNLFTKGQKSRMRTILSPGGPREDLAVAECHWCLDNINVTQGVSMGTTDTKQAKIAITASNSIATNGQAIYHAEQEILLTANFEALKGSIFRAHIDWCSATYVSKTSETQNEDIIEANSLNTGLQIHPNPTKNTLNIKFRNQNFNNATIQIYNLNGATVYSNTTGKNNINRLELNVSNFQSGMYIIKVINDKGEVFTDKMIKE